MDDGWMDRYIDDGRMDAESMFPAGKQWLTGCRTLRKPVC